MNVTLFYVYSAYARYLIRHVHTMREMPANVANVCVQLNQKECITILQGNYTLLHTWKYPTRKLSLKTLLKFHFPTSGIFQDGEYLSGEASPDNTSVVGYDSRNLQRQTRGIYSTLYNTIPSAKSELPLTNLCNNL